MVSVRSSTVTWRICMVPIQARTGCTRSPICLPVDYAVATRRGTPVWQGGRGPANVSSVAGNAPERQADVAQLVAHHLAKVRVAGSNPVVRSERPPQVTCGVSSVEWPRGEATACKAVYTGSNPVSTSAIDEGDWRSGSALP